MIGTSCPVSVGRERAPIPVVRLLTCQGGDGYVQPHPGSWGRGHLIDRWTSRIVAGEEGTGLDGGVGLATGAPELAT